MSRFRVAAGRSLALPSIIKGKIHGPRGSQPYGMSGGFLREGELLPESFVLLASTKVERNQQTLLANLLADGVVVEER